MRTGKFNVMSYLGRISARRQSAGFTIMELVIVVVIVGIIAALTFVSFSGVRNSAQKREVGAEAGSVATQLRKAKAEDGSYPTSLDDIEKSTEYTHDYNRIDSASFCVSATKGSYTFRVTSGNTEPIEGSCDGVLADGFVCPTGYIVVPGNSSFGTSPFCVMKYEAKILGNDNGTQAYSSTMVPDSRAAGTPWVNITQINATAEAQTACDGCHLITEAEWMTIVANVLSVPSNWSGGAVGSGYIYSGHSDNVPANSIAASSNDTDGFSGTGQSGTSSQRRTLTLTNGEVIWDVAGNVWEWTNSTIAGGQQPGLSGESAYAFKEWNNPSLLFRGLPATSRPSAISGVVAGYSSAQGIGWLYSNYGEVDVRGFVRGSDWSCPGCAGVLALALGFDPNFIYAGFGFRVAR